MVGVLSAPPEGRWALLRWIGAAGAVGLILWAGLSSSYLSSRQDRVVWEGTLEGERLSAELEVELGNTVQLQAEAPLDNGWVAIRAELLDPQREQRFSLPLELSRYSGQGWSAGSTQGSLVVSSLPQGPYLLELERDPESTYLGAVAVVLREDVPLMRFVFATLLLVVAPPVCVGLWAVHGGPAT